MVMSALNPFIWDPGRRPIQDHRDGRLRQPGRADPQGTGQRGAVRPARHRRDDVHQSARPVAGQVCPHGDDASLRRGQDQPAASREHSWVHRLVHRDHRQNTALVPASGARTVRDQPPRRRITCSGRVAQWESARFTRERSLVQAQPCPSRTFKMRQPPETARVHGGGRAEPSGEIRRLAAAAFRSRMIRPIRSASPARAAVKGRRLGGSQAHG